MRCARVGSSGPSARNCCLLIALLTRLYQPKRNSGNAGSTWPSGSDHCGEVGEASKNNPDFAMTCKFCNAWRPKQSNFYNALFKITLRMAKTYSSSVSFFLRVIAFFALRTEKMRRPGGGLCHCKISILIFALLRICEISVQCFTLELQFFTLLGKTVFCSKNCNALAIFWLHLGAV